MKPLPPKYFDDALAPLFDENPIGEAGEVVDRIVAELKSTKRQGQAFGDGKQLLEAKIGVRLGGLLGFTHFTLAPANQERFDFTLRRDDKMVSFDATEARDRHRNLVVEYDGETGDEWSHESGAEILYQHGLFAKTVRKRLKEKCRDADKNLVVYVNTGWTPHDEEIEKCLAQWHAEFRGRWATAYILFGLSGATQIVPELRDIAEWREPPRGDPADFEKFFNELCGGN